MQPYKHDHEIALNIVIFLLHKIKEDKKYNSYFFC